MKTAVIFADGVKQIVFTPETDQEKYALSLMNAGDDIELLVTTGTMYDSQCGMKPFSANVTKCKSGYLRVFSDNESRILVLKPRKKDEK